MRENIPARAGAPDGGLEGRQTLRSVCIYCGSSPGADPAFAAAAADLGHRFAKANVALVYGGGDVGLMGSAARAALAAGGRVTGIIPDFLKRRESMLDAVQELIVVRDMHTRKRLMFERADAFVALPGGIGTLEELIEQMTWSQLGRHRKPILMLDIGGFWRPLLVLLDHMREQGFIRPGLELTYLVAQTPGDVLPLLREAMPPAAADSHAELIAERF